MAEIFAAAAAVLAAVSLAVCILILKRTKTGGTQDVKGDLVRLEQMMDRTLYLSETNAQNVQHYLDFLSKSQSGSLKGLQESMDALNAATEKRLSEMQRTVAGEIRYMAEQNAKIWKTSVRRWTKS